MLQRILVGLGVLNLLFVIFLGVLFFQGQNVVYVDSVKLMNGYKGMQDARAAYQQKAGAWKANIDTLASEVQKQIFTYEKESPRMSAKERQLSQELIRTKQKQFTDYQQAMNTQAQQEDSKMTGEVVTQVNAYLKKYGEANGYKIILAATEYGNIAYADEGLDITEKVLEGLNNEYVGK
ncbi:OmpH family outer membrane protein [Dawidia soli]|uniref:OmpH family outer membrane protein n=1 Tax=Dawidia soli TaxID=2782352 RepID=A0AAP2GD18_9BACT|nr:OmpH family outer membrane protein [Dawidia soli]MBT1686914.1 OmpH family outer membrane protein [Dawidia soli]